MHVDHCDRDCLVNGVAGVLIILRFGPHRHMVDVVGGVASGGVLRVFEIGAFLEAEIAVKAVDLEQVAINNIGCLDISNVGSVIYERVGDPGPLGVVRIVREHVVGTILPVHFPRLTSPPIPALRSRA